MSQHEEDYYAPWNVEDRAAARLEREEALYLHYEELREERLMSQQEAIEEEEISLSLKLRTDGTE
jgi:hypothetical protein